MVLNSLHGMMPINQLMAEQMPASRVMIRWQFPYHYKVNIGLPQRGQLETHFIPIKHNYSSVSGNL